MDKDKKEKKDKEIISAVAVILFVYFLISDQTKVNRRIKRTADNIS